MNSHATIAAPDEEKLKAFAGKVMTDAAGAYAMLLSHIGDRTGVYAALRDHGPCTAEALAGHAGVDPRYLREWLSAQAAGGYVEYDPARDSFWLSPEQALVLAQEGHPAFMQGFCDVIVSQCATHETAVEVFRSGRGRDWGEHHSCCFCGVDRFFRPGYVANLLSAWLPALDGVVEKLERGARIADIGCGHGSSAVMMAQAFPRSSVVGYDIHAPSIEAARRHAAEEGAANARFVAAAAKELPQAAGIEGGFDLVCMFDSLHDMGDPVGAARAVREILAPGGVLMLVEPLAGDSLAENLHLLGQLFYSGSTLICTPASRAQDVGLALGAQAGPRRLRAVLNQAGFSRVRVANRSEANMVLEAQV